jgi:hypothetical protein
MMPVNSLFFLTAVELWNYSTDDSDFHNVSFLFNGFNKKVQAHHYAGPYIDGRNTVFTGVLSN